MQRNKTLFDVVAAHEVAVDVVQHLVRVDVRVVVGGRNRLGVVVVQAGRKRADHEVVALKRLVHGRRLVDAAGDRLKVPRVERVGVVVAVPAHHVKRVRGVDHVVNESLFFDFDGELAQGVGGRQVGRAAQVAFAERRVLKELAKLVAVALGRQNRRPRLGDEEAVVGRIEGDLVDGSARNHQVVPLAEPEGSEQRSQHAAALVHKNELVRVAVFVEVAVGSARGCRVLQGHVVVEEYRGARRQKVVGGLHVKALEHPWVEVVAEGGYGAGVDGFRNRADHRRAVQVVEQ